MKVEENKHNKTCTCKDCGIISFIKDLKFIAFTEHRGYMADPVAFDTYSEAVEFCKENHSFVGGYVVQGVMVWEHESMQIDTKFFKKSMERLKKVSKKFRGKNENKRN